MEPGRDPFPLKRNMGHTFSCGCSLFIDCRNV
jgi:hypothetical protein